MKHITDLEIQRYYAHAMNDTEERGLLAHISDCEYCAGRWVNAFPMEEMLTPPVALRFDLEQQMQAERIPSKRLHSYRAWYQYCAKVILAMGFAITVLFLGDFRMERSDLQKTEQRKEADMDIFGQISHQTEKFSDAISDWSDSIGRSLRGEPQK